jgi:uncharacterized membrane protein
MTQVINSEDNNISKKANTSTQVSLSEFSGPIPPPSVLSLYKDVDDSFAERIFTMAEKQMAHRHTLETQSLDTEIEQIKLNANLYKRGQLFAFIIGIFTIGIGGVASIMGATVSGGIIGTGGLIGLVSVFLFSNKFEKNTKAVLDT